MNNDQLLDQELSTSISLTSEMREHLLEAAKWGKFLAIVGFVGVGIMVLFSLFAGTVFSMMGTMAGTATNAPNPFAGINGIFITLMYLSFAVLYFFPILYLYRFAIRTKRAIEHYQPTELREGIRNLKFMFKLVGIFTAAILGLYAMIFVFGGILFAVSAF